MKLILYAWNANNEQILSDNLIQLGFEVIWFRKECRHYTRDMELAMELIQQIHEKRAEAVISFNYYPIISMVCHTCQIPYYAWVYDCPHFTLYAKQMNDACNHIGIFDRDMVRQLEKYGGSTVYHVPLSVDAAYFSKVIDSAPQREKDRYRCDISFVGSLYTDEHNYYDMLFPEAESRAASAVCTGSAEEMRDGCKGTIRDMLRRQCFSYQEDDLRQAVTGGQLDLSAVQEGMERQGLMLGEDYFAKPEDILLAAVLEKKVTVEERKTLLSKVAECFQDTEMLCNGSPGHRDSSDGNLEKKHKKYDFRLYTGSDTRDLPKLYRHNRGRVDYRTQMPLVFSGSRINLNITLRSIHSGIPLRVLDIMACGGFVLTNWQPEIAEHFRDGEEIAIYSSLEECMEKVGYYLAHEEERKKIAQAGHRKVKEKFSYQAGLMKLFEIG